MFGFIILKKYIKDHSILSYKEQNVDSPILKAILKKRDLIHKGTRWKSVMQGLLIFLMIFVLKKKSFGEFCIDY